jgi:hypothetical protein
MWIQLYSISGKKSTKSVPATPTTGVSVESAPGGVSVGNGVTVSPLPVGEGPGVRVGDGSGLAVSVGGGVSVAGITVGA